ncbi:TetR/AcrR family transcriptional regulator [Paenibacillus sp. GCM10027626]|uniref:TetR/AcrR family transcriptional regulator n=1 Tax=Paenibacillus sp. GCM10027626 TaxID=3273411 RepID=UPI00362F7CC9
MAPKRKFTKEQLIEAAFEIAQAEGVEQITIRKVADKIGSSIAPIYVNFKDADELKQAVVRKIVDVSHQMLATRQHEDPFLNIGIASMQFARAYPVLFNELLMLRGQGRYLEAIQLSIDDMLVQMRENRDLQGFTTEELLPIMFKMQVFQLGLSVMEVNGLLPPQMGEEQLTELLEQTGSDIMAAARLRRKEQTAGINNVREE